MVFSEANMRQYFSTLPVYIQESIQQSGIQFNTKSELEDFVRNLEESKN